jgi:hypothetical protein
LKEGSGCNCHTPEGNTKPCPVHARAPRGSDDGPVFVLVDLRDGEVNDEHFTPYPPGHRHAGEPGCSPDNCIIADNENEVECIRVIAQVIE